MYLLVVVTLMLVFPVGSIGLDSVVSEQAVSAALVLKWFVVWSVGVLRPSLFGV